MDAKKLKGLPEMIAARRAWRELLVEHHNVSAQLLCNNGPKLHHPTEGL
jgi:hypothetical protein